MAINVGDTADAEFIVTPADTAAALSTPSGDTFPPVFATSRMVALMELAAARLMRSLLQAGEMSVGVSIDTRHTAATPLGAKVRAVATYTGRDGKIFLFNVAAFDEAGLIGSGHHTRAIVSSDRLLAGAAKRRSAQQPTS
jgi:fluoroacetyl-CoA thioesterase